MAQPALRRFLQTLRERWFLVLGLFVLVVVAALLYVATADKVYEAEADILVTPVPTQEAVLSTVGLIVQSADPSLDVETANQLIDSPKVAEEAAKKLGQGESGAELLDQISVAPIPESNIVTVTASGPSPEVAAERANVFAETAIESRVKTIAANIEKVLPQLRQDLAEAADPASSESIADTLAALVAFRASGNATMQVETQATPPSSASSPRTVLIIVGGVIIGLLLGIAAAFTAQALDPRLRREEQLRAMFSLPILARVAREKSRRGPITRADLSPVGREGYRTLRAAVAAAAGDDGGPRSILVGGSGASEGKSTTAINLATALAIAGKKVILIDGDLRRPAIGAALETGERPGVVGVLHGEVPLEGALTQAPAGEPPPARRRSSGNRLRRPFLAARRPAHAGRGRRTGRLRDRRLAAARRRRRRPAARPPRRRGPAGRAPRPHPDPKGPRAGRTACQQRRAADRVRPARRLATAAQLPWLRLRGARGSRSGRAGQDHVAVRAAPLLLQRLAQEDQRFRVGRAERDDDHQVLGHREQGKRVGRRLGDRRRVDDQPRSGRSGHCDQPAGVDRERLVGLRVGVGRSHHQADPRLALELGDGIARGPAAEQGGQVAARAQTEDRGEQRPLEVELDHGRGFIGGGERPRQPERDERA